jgi:hypothetical protein
VLALKVGSGVPDQMEPSGSILSFARVRGPKKFQRKLADSRASRQGRPEKKGFFFFFSYLFFLVLGFFLFFSLVLGFVIFSLVLGVLKTQVKG